MRSWLATTMSWMVVTVANRRHMVARSPATVVATEGFIVVQSVSATRYNAAGRYERQKPNHEGDR